MPPQPVPRPLSVKVTGRVVRPVSVSSISGPCLGVGLLRCALGLGTHVAVEGGPGDPGDAEEFHDLPGPASPAVKLLDLGGLCRAELGLGAAATTPGFGGLEAFAGAFT